ncbi:MAG: site-specific integrase, partial [Shewanella sp.]|nr:site-specific integrase [Shewanella sp.]
MTLAEHIVQYFKRHSISCSVRDDIEWTLKRWVELNSLTERHINHETIKIIHSKIKVVPTGKQRRYRQAVEDICLYLRDVCQWTVYEPLSEKLIDHDLIWADKLSQHAHSANVLFQCYQKQKSIFLKLSQPPSIEFLTVTLAICLAPFSFEYIADLLNHPERIECSNNQLSVKIYHRVSKSNTSQHPPFTRYKLDLFSYKLLSTYFATQKNQQNETENSLNKKIINWLNQQHFELSTICTRDLPFLFQSIWLYQYQVPHTLLKDIATPERHVDFDIKRREVTNVHKLKPGTVDALFKISLDFSWAKGGTNSSKLKQQDWSHQTLIKQLLKTSRAELIRQLQEQAEPEWQTDNVLPKLFYQYTSELIEFGGITKPRLAQSTIKKYTSISRLLEQSPLSYSDAIHESKLQAWADHNYLKLDDEHKLLMHFFLRFISQQSLTDHLQLDHLQAPTQPMTVDSYRMAPESINNIIQILLNSKSGSHVQRLFSAVAVIISYFGMLRRGEILRLRVRDIVSLQLDQCRLFQLEITKTPEGQPKSSRPRTVFIALPENYAKLIRLVLHFKHGSCQERPLLGFDNEKLSVRNIYYLLPVTRAIKLICGSDARFHHLRHAGAHLMMLQMMRMCYSASKP